MSKKIGFIGCGNMGGIILGSTVKSGKYNASDIYASDASKELLEKKKEELSINVSTDNKETAKNADILFLTIKPQYYETVIKEVKDCVKKDVIIVTVAPGKTLSWLKDMFEKDIKVIRTMPNTPAMVGEGMIALCKNEFITDDELKEVRSIFDAFALTEVVNENLMDVVTAVSGSSPAYVFMFIEAMADAAVAGGMTRPMAYKFASQAVLGSAKMVLETGKHPGELKDIVCSPAGTTIQAVRVLEEKGMRSAVFEAMMACLDISRKM